MRLARIGLVGGMVALTLAAAPLAFAQGEVAVPDVQAALAAAPEVQTGGVSELLGPGEEGIGPLAGAPQPVAATIGGPADETAAQDSAPAPKARAAKAHRPAPSRAVRRAKAHPQG